MQKAWQSAQTSNGEGRFRDGLIRKKFIIDCLIQRRFSKSDLFTMALVNPPVSTIDRSCEKNMVDSETLRDEKEQSIEPIQGRCRLLQAS